MSFKFKPVLSQIDFPQMEKELLRFWYEEGVVKKYLQKNDNSRDKFSFLDGPITANNPMGVHHAWGRTYKDLWQRFFNMRGYKQRFQNGFDEQGLWVEVEVEKELGLKSKKEIENLIPGDKFASLEKFVNLCKERVQKYSAIQTEQSKRLGYFMDWDNSYHTSADKNNYTIWNFLKVINEKGWLYKGRDSVPWCPRCGTAISQHEILTEEYKEITHQSVYFKLPLKSKKGVNLLVWTTTPWTIPANVAVAVDLNIKYSEVEFEGERYIIAEDLALKIFPEGVKKGSFKGGEIVGWEYDGPFDNLPAVKREFSGYHHRVVASDPLILPITTVEGTGLVHMAPGAGAEDFALGKREGLPVLAPLDESAVYVDGYGFLSGLTTNKATLKIIDELEKNNYLVRVTLYLHRYPTCWRCKTELVWRVVEEWYIAMDKKDDSGRTYRQQMIEVAKKIKWLPVWGKDRELDWLKNMHDWLISKKRYWGLALPIWECSKCRTINVIGSKDELKDKAIEGWDEFDGHSPHRPWVDGVKIKCSNCQEVITRISDVGNPWLDAGIVPFSTMPSEWFPSDFITESFPGQFKNWFYSLIAMSTALAETNPFKNVLGFASVRDEKGEEMHKSKGNAMEFNEAADKIGVDVMRWLYVIQNPENNLNFGYNITDEIRRRLHLILWNSYKYFLDYAVLIEWQPHKISAEKRSVLDKWILAKLTELTFLINEKLEKFDAATPSRAIEDFVINSLSTWYIRRSRDRVGSVASKEDEDAFMATLYQVLLSLSKLLAPFMPFIAEEMYKNLTEDLSVHLTDYPKGDKDLLDNKLVSGMNQLRQLVEIGHAKRKGAGIKLRQPLAKVIYSLDHKLTPELEKIMADELNIKKVEYKKLPDDKMVLEMDTKITPKLQDEGEVRELIRKIQQLRKEMGLTLKDEIVINSPLIPEDKDLLNLLLKQTNAEKIVLKDKLFIQIVGSQ